MVPILARQFTSYDTSGMFLNFSGLHFSLTLKRSLNEIQDVKCLARSSMQQSCVPSHSHLLGVSNFVPLRDAQIATYTHKKPDQMFPEQN